MTILTNIFSEWISDICSPPPKVLTRIDTIFLYYNPKLRDSLNNPLIIWPLYRSLFSELLYNTNWLELMDFIICSSPQFIEFLVIAWVELNINQILIDPNTFHSTKRTIITKQLIKKAQNIINKCPTTLLTHKQFQPLNKDSYPIIKCNYNSMILRSLQTDQDKLTKLQSKILKQRKESEEIEKLKAKRKQTMETIQQLYHMREEEERIKTIKEINSLNEQLKQLKLESKRLRIINEKQFLEDWDKDWDSTFDDIIRGKIKMFPKRLKNDNQIENDGIRFQSLANQRNLDLEIRNARKESVNRNNVKKFELETKNNQRMMENEFLKLENPPKLIVDV